MIGNALGLSCIWITDMLLRIRNSHTQIDNPLPWTGNLVFLKIQVKEKESNSPLNSVDVANFGQFL